MGTHHREGGHCWWVALVQFLLRPAVYQTKLEESCYVHFPPTQQASLPALSPHNPGVAERQAYNTIFGETVNTNFLKSLVGPDVGIEPCACCCSGRHSIHYYIRLVSLVWTPAWNLSTGKSQHWASSFCNFLYICLRRNKLFCSVMLLFSCPPFV